MSVHQRDSDALRSARFNDFEVNSDDTVFGDSDGLLCLQDFVSGQDQ